MESVYAVVRDGWVLEWTSSPQTGEKLHHRLQKISAKFSKKF